MDLLFTINYITIVLFYSDQEGSFLIKNIIMMKNKLNKPVIAYTNIELQKNQIYKDNKNKTGVYRWVNSINNKSYVGSSVNISQRLLTYFSQKKLKKYLVSYRSNIYKSILKHGYLNFKFEILEYITFPFDISTEEKKKIILEKKQYYIDSLKPEYNILKIAGSRLGSKATFETKKALSIALRGRKKLKNVEILIGDEIIGLETKLKVYLNTRGISVKIYDTSNELIQKFPNINSAAKFFGVGSSTISRIYKTGVSYDNYTYKFEPNDLRVWVYNCDNILIEILENRQKISAKYNIPKSTLSNYIKSSKLYKNKFYFYTVDSENKDYFQDSFK
jgi:group I intron endonuclease